MEDNFVFILLDTPDKERLEEEAKKRKVDLMYFCKTKLLEDLKVKI